MKVYVIKGSHKYPEKVFATIEEAKNYALEMAKYEERKFLNKGDPWKWGTEFKTEIKVSKKAVMLNKYWYSPYVNEWHRLTFRRSIIEKEFIGQ